MDISVEYAKKQAEATNKAVYIIGRTAGEDKDNYNGAGSYLLTDEEKENLKNITEAFDDVCVILNVSNIVDVKWRSLRVTLRRHFLYGKAEWKAVTLL